MNKKDILAEFLFSLLMVCQAASQRPVSPDWAHNPKQPYNVWVFCIDTSLSPQPEQFHRLQMVAEQMIKRDVGANDLVFLIEIRSGFDSTQPFQMPTGTSLASRKPAAAKALSDAKAKVIAAIYSMRQNSGATDLKSTLEVAFDLLRQNPRATKRQLVVGSDFLNDLGLVSANPPPPRRRAVGMETLLLLTYPKPEYLRQVRLTASGLLESVETKWTAYFNDTGASSVSVRLVDAVYAAIEGAQPHGQTQSVGAVGPARTHR